MQKTSTAQNLVTSYVLTIKILLTLNNALLRYGNVFSQIFGFRETIIQMSLAHRGDFITKTSVVDQISRRQDLCRTFS